VAFPAVCAGDTERAIAHEGQADGVFEGGGVRGVAFAGAMAAAEQFGGVRAWVNVAGTSAGAIAAALLAAGYDAAAARELLFATDYRRFPDYGFGGKYVSGVFNAVVRMRGLAPGNAFRDWLGSAFRNSPLATADPRFGDLVRTDLPSHLSDEERARARYRLRVVASDVSNGRMLVLPDDVVQYEDGDGRRYDTDEFPVVEAVRMSMSIPILFTPVMLRRDGRPAFVVDGGLLSNFPVFLFDSPRPERPTWGFRLHGGTGRRRPPYHPIPRPLWELPLLKAMFLTPMEAADIEHMAHATGVRTVSIPTGAVRANDFQLTKEQLEQLYASGYEEAARFFQRQPQREYINSFGATLDGTMPAP
jgi:NTE family protein